MDRSPDGIWETHRAAHYSYVVLKIALSPRSLAFLTVSLIIAALFVVLSMWQLSSSDQAAVVADPDKDTVKPLTEVIKPGEVVTSAAADHTVEISGTYDPGSTVVIPGRLHDGVDGYWVVSELVVQDSAGLWDTADGPMSVPVARGWIGSSDQVPAAPSEPVTVAGRLLPPESPLINEDLPEGQLPSLSPAQLTNVWDAPLYSGYVAAAAEVPAAEEMPVTQQGTLAPEASVLSDELFDLDIDQQPTDTSLNMLNLFYALEWIVFAGFAVFLWWRFVRDEYLRRQDPQKYFYLEGDYFWDEEEQSFYYWDERDQSYYYFDDQPAARSTSDAVPAAENRTHPEHGASHERTHP